MSDRPIPTELSNEWLRAATASLAMHRASNTRANAQLTATLAASDADALLHEFMTRFPHEVPRTGDDE